MKEINIFILLTQIHFILLTQNHFCLSTFNRNFQILQLKLKYLDSFHPIFYRGIERRWLLTKFYRSEDTSFLDCFITPLYPPLFFHFTLLFFFLFSSAHGTAVLYRSYSLFPVPVSLDLIFHSFTASLPRYLTAPVYSLLRVFIPLRSSLLFYFSRAIFPQKPLGLCMPSYSTEPDKIAIHSQLYDRSIKTSNNTRYRDTTI